MMFAGLVRRRHFEDPVSGPGWAVSVSARVASQNVDLRNSAGEPLCDDTREAKTN